MARSWDKDKERARKAEYRRRKKQEASEAPEKANEPPPEVETVSEGEVVQTAALAQALKGPGTTGQYPQVRETVLPPLEEYEALGRRYGEDEADRRGQTGQEREWRIERAIAYQRWLRAEGQPPT